MASPDYDPDKLDRLALLLDGDDDAAAAEARQKAKDIRAGLLTAPDLED